MTHQHDLGFACSSACPMVIFQLHNESGEPIYERQGCGELWKDERSAKYGVYLIGVDAPALRGSGTLEIPWRRS